MSEKRKMNIGKLKAIFDREINYVSKLNFLMVGYLFISDAGWSWWYLMIIPAILIWTYIDIRYIMKNEIDYVWSKSEILKKIIRDAENKKISDS